MFVFIIPSSNLHNLCKIDKITWHQPNLSRSRSRKFVRRAYIVVIQTADSQTGRQTDTDTDRNMDHLGNNVDQFLWVPSIA